MISWAGKRPRLALSSRDELDSILGILDKGQTYEMQRTGMVDVVGMGRSKGEC